MFKNKSDCHFFFILFRNGFGLFSVPSGSLVRKSELIHHKQKKEGKKRGKGRRKKGGVQLRAPKTSLVSLLNCVKILLTGRRTVLVILYKCTVR